MAQINGKVGARAIGAGPLPVCSATEKGFGVWYWWGEGEGGCGACVEGGRDSMEKSRRWAVAGTWRPSRRVKRSGKRPQKAERET
jgi:hypothetical protein